MSNTKQIQGLQEQVEKFKKQSDEYLNGWKRAQADFENFKKNQTKLMTDFKKFTEENLILKLLPISDNFNLALKHAPKDFNKSEWVQGILQIKNQLEELLKESGIQEIVVKKGDKFNPEFNQAIRAVKGKEKDIIIKVLQKGYTLNDKLLRPTKVEVGQ